MTKAIRAGGGVIGIVMAERTAWTVICRCELSLGYLLSCCLGPVVDTGVSFLADTTERERDEDDQKQP